jgi:hypothetical protein
MRGERIPNRPIDHPDLIDLSRSLREQMDRTLESEMSAARSAARRRRSLRDRLLDAEDAEQRVAVGTVSGEVLRGAVVAVGTDHFDLETSDRRSVVALSTVSWIEARS